jgi:hypothetical protein
MNTTPSPFTLTRSHSTDRPILPFGHQWVSALRQTSYRQHYTTLADDIDSNFHLSALGILSLVQSRLRRDGPLYRDGDTSSMLSRHNPLYPILGQLGYLPIGTKCTVGPTDFLTISGLNNFARLTLPQIADVIEQSFTLSHSTDLSLVPAKQIQFRL